MIPNQEAYEMTDANERRPYIRVSLLIRGGDDPSEISRLLNMVPDESYRKGEAIPLPPNAKYKVRKQRVYASSIWKINARLKQYSYDVEDYVLDVLSCVREVADKIARLDRRRFSVTIDVSLDLLTDAPTVAVGASNKTLTALARLGASYDVDLYVWAHLPPYAIEGLGRYKTRH